MTPSIDPTRLSREELDDLLRRLKAEQSRRNDQQDLDIVVHEELEAARQRIMERVADRQTFIGIFGAEALRKSGE